MTIGLGTWDEINLFNLCPLLCNLSCDLASTVQPRQNLHFVVILLMHVSPTSHQPERLRR